ncbi:MAG: hypothetical protein AMXMBFR7_26600 [Planctomycetota bacterium]
MPSEILKNRRKRYALDPVCEAIAPEPFPTSSQFENLALLKLGASQVGSPRVKANC